MITINDPAILAEVNVAFDAYETALMTNDIEAMDALFWAFDTDGALRFWRCAVWHR